MADWRLPTVDGDDGAWGDILNQFIGKEHYNDGTDNAADNGGHQKITVRAGTSSAGTAPLKFTSGTLMSSPEAGAVEFNSNRLYFTQTTGPTRKVIAAFDDSSGATGDLYYRDSSGHFVRLGIGSTNNVLKVSSGLPAWGTPQVTYVTATKSGAFYQSTTSDDILLASATGNDVEISLPDATTCSGKVLTVKLIAGGWSLLLTSAGGTIDGSSFATITRVYTSVQVVSNGTNWYVL